MNRLRGLVPDGQVDRRQRRVGLGHDDSLEAGLLERGERMLEQRAPGERRGRLRLSETFAHPAGEDRSDHVAHEQQP
jgi:hypothetical protein